MVLVRNFSLSTSQNIEPRPLCIKDKDDIMGSICQHKGVYLVLLDLSSAFDTVHHEMLLKRLVDVIGIRGNVLKWVQSYLSGRTTILYDDMVLSDPSSLGCHKAPLLVHLCFLFILFLWGNHQTIWDISPYVC